LRSAFAQTAAAEVIVTDDASSDGTSEMVRAEFPEARLLRSEVCIGLIAQRNRAAQAATTEFLFSIDDDAEFGSLDTVERTLAEFDHTSVGAVAIPHIDTPTSRVVNAPAPLDGQVWCVASFTGTAYAVRRDLFLKLGGYREHLVHQGEESDFCIRLLAAGFVVRLGAAAMIQHHESPRRSYERMDFYGRRNDVLFAWHNVPLLYLPMHMVATTVNGLRWAFKVRRVRRMASGLAHGYVDSLRFWGKRQPVSPKVYWLFRRLRKQGPVRLEEIESSLPRAKKEGGH
jgi:GT2 family glycosyltransferase